MTRNENDSHFIQRQRWCYTTIQVRTDLRRSLVYALTQCRANCDIRPGCLGVCSVDLEYLQVWSQHNLPRQPGQPSLAIHFWCTSNIWTGPFLLITNRELYLWQIKICYYIKSMLFYLYAYVSPWTNIFYIRSMRTHAEFSPFLLLILLSWSMHSERERCDKSR